MKEERTSFLSVARCPRDKRVGSVLPEMSKSFLVLFFKKEHSSFGTCPW
jgi:hypothetical protein